jgi:hypothetical protein
VTASIASIWTAAVLLLNRSLRMLDRYVGHSDVMIYLAVKRPSVRLVGWPDPQPFFVIFSFSIYSFSLSFEDFFTCNGQCAVTEQVIVNCQPSIFVSQRCARKRRAQRSFRYDFSSRLYTSPFRRTPAQRPWASGSVQCRPSSWPARFCGRYTVFHEVPVVVVACVVCTQIRRFLK